MGILETFFIALGLSMDAFAVAICKGLAMKKMDWKKAIIIGGYFGIFQMVMPIIGYLLGIGFSAYIESIDHWIAFILLSAIGVKMIKESFDKEQSINDTVEFKTMVVLAIATSIDAMAIGITYAFLDVTNSYLSFVLIGFITFVISMIGVNIGKTFGARWGEKAELLGGIILIIIGIKILSEHLLLK